MEKEYRREAQKQYFHYFRFWFLAVIIVLIITSVFGIRKFLLNDKTENIARNNNEAPAERVFDYANVLTDAEETKLRELIARREAQIKCDIVLVTIRESVETASVSWDTAMRDYADDFYDNNNYGYNKVHGDGVLLLDNWQNGEAGSWLTTTGIVYERFGNYEINMVLDEVYRYIDNSPYRAYEAYINEVYNLMAAGGGSTFSTITMPLSLVIIIPIIVLILFIIIGLTPAIGKTTVTPRTYLAPGGSVMNARADDFIRKHVTSRRIPRNDGGGGGGGGGRGGGHVSRGGVSHGGGGRRR